MTDYDCTTETCRSNICRCTTNADCQAGTHCALGYCMSDCTDSVKDDAETDVDCGGGTCGACGVGKACVTDYDCTTETCRSNVCRCTTNADCASGTHCSLGYCIM
jgi:Cys-rich repeat protein